MVLSTVIETPDVLDATVTGTFMTAQPVRGIPIDDLETETAARAWLGNAGLESPGSRAATPH